MSTSRRSSTARAARLARARRAVRDLALGDLAADRQDRVQRRRRVLEDEADILGRACAASVSASAPMTSVPSRRIDPRTRAVVRQEAGDRERRDALARAGLADDAEHLVGIDVEIDAAHRRHRRVADPPNVTSSARTDRTGSPPSGHPRLAAGSRARSRLEPDRPRHEHVVDVEREAVRRSWRRRSGRCRRCWSGSRRPPRPAPC